MQTQAESFQWTDTDMKNKIDSDTKVRRKIKKGETKTISHELTHRNKSIHRWIELVITWCGWSLPLKEYREWPLRREGRGSGVSSTLVKNLPRKDCHAQGPFSTPSCCYYTWKMRNKTLFFFLNFIYSFCYYYYYFLLFNMHLLIDNMLLSPLTWRDLCDRRGCRPYWAAPGCGECCGPVARWWWRPHWSPPTAGPDTPREQWLAGRQLYAAEWCHHSLGEGKKPCKCFSDHLPF